MKIHFGLTLLTFILINTLSAQQTQLPSGIGFFVYKPSIEQLEKKMKMLISIDTSYLSNIDNWTYHLTKSSVLLYSGKDSSVFYFLKAHQYNPSANCKVMRGMNPEYLRDLPNFDHDTYINDCNVKYPLLNTLERKKSELELRLMINDQSERSKDNINWEVQNQLDLINRNIIDSLYNAHGSFQPFDKFEQDAFSYVIHHSEDCTWVYKWLEIWLNESKNNNVKGGEAIGPAFKRMISNEHAFCCKEDNVRCLEFEEIINEKYKKYKYLWK